MQFVDRVRDLADFLGGVDRQRLGRRFITGPDPGNLAFEVLVRNFRAPSRSTRNGRTSERATSSTTMSAAMMAATTRTVSRIAALRRLWAWSSTALVTFAVVSLMICAAMPSVVCTECSRSGLLTSLVAGLDINPIRVTICCCRFLASCEPTPSTSAIPNSVDGSVPARVIIEVRSSGSGRSAPRVISSCCIIIWPRAPTARLSPCAAARICSLSTRTEPSMAFSAVNRMGAYVVTRTRKPRVFFATLSSSAWPPSSIASTPALTSGATFVPASRASSSCLRAS